MCEWGGGARDGGGGGGGVRDMGGEKTERSRNERG